MCEAGNTDERRAKDSMEDKASSIIQMIQIYTDQMIDFSEVSFEAPGGQAHRKETVYPSSTPLNIVISSQNELIRSLRNTVEECNSMPLYCQMQHCRNWLRGIRRLLKYGQEQISADNETNHFYWCTDWGETVPEANTEF